MGCQLHAHLAARLASMSRNKAPGPGIPAAADAAAAAVSSPADAPAILLPAVEEPPLPPSALAAVGAALAVPALSLPEDPTATTVDEAEDCIGLPKRGAAEVKDPRGAPAADTAELSPNFISPADDENNDFLEAVVSAVKPKVVPDDEDDVKGTKLLGEAFLPSVSDEGSLGTGKDTAGNVVNLSCNGINEQDEQRCTMPCMGVFVVALNTHTRAPRMFGSKCALCRFSGSRSRS